MASDFRLKDTLPALTDRIVSTYAEVGTIHHLGHCPLPNYDAVISATENLKEILYPGYRRRDRLHLSNVTYHVGDLIDGLHDRLTSQIARAMCHGAGDNVRCNPQHKTGDPQREGHGYPCKEKQKEQQQETSYSKNHHVH